MTKTASSRSTGAKSISPQGSTMGPMAIIGALFFVFGFVTWVNSPLILYLRIACELNNFESYLVTFASYIAYLITGVPAAWLLKKTGFKKGMSVGLFIMAAGALLFIPAALTRTYGLFLLGLFAQGAGLTVLQTASNPYITILGPRESAAKRISIMGICNKIGGSASAFFLGGLFLNNADQIVARVNTMDPVAKAAELSELASRVITPYLVMMVVFLIIALVIHFSSLPEIDTEQEDETVAAANTGKTSIFQFPHLLLGVLSLFLYVGVEVMAVDTVTSYAATQGISIESSSLFGALTLWTMIFGYVVGIITIPKIISQEKALQISAALGVLFVLAALFTDGYISVLSISLLGLANSIMWPAIWPLAIADLGRFTKIGSSFLIMAIAGGALLPLLYGYLTDITGAQQAYWMMVPCYLIILYFAAAGHKLRTR